MRHYSPKSTIAALLATLLLGCLSVISVKPRVFAQRSTDNGDYLQRWPNIPQAYAPVSDLPPLLRLPTPKEKCKWYHEQTLVFPASLSDKDRKALDKLLDALVKAIDAAASEVNAVKTAIDKLGPAGDVVDVVLIYACEDDDGNITRKKVDLDNTENIHWAAKAARDPDNARQQQVIVTKHKPQGTCCKAKTTKDETLKHPVALPTPPTETSPGYKVESTTSPGLNTRIITTPNGKLIVNVPDDLYASDTFSGTVLTEPAGQNEAERVQNQDQLNGIVLEIEQQKTRVAQKIFTHTIPAKLTREAQSLSLIVNGKHVVNTAIPISNATPPSPPSEPQLPTCGQIGRNIVVADHCDGIIAPTDSCSIGGTRLQPLAESPRQRVMQNTSQTPGPTQLKYVEQGREVSGPFQNLSVSLTSPNTNLQRGQKTTLEVVALVQGIQQDASLDLVNDTPGTVTISGGDIQHFTIHRSDLQADGTYKQEFTVTANQAGAWAATATVSCVGGGPAGPIPTPTPTPAPTGVGAMPSPGPKASPSPCDPITFPYTITKYTVTDLGTLPPPGAANQSIAVGINDSEYIVGVSFGSFAVFSSEHAFGVYAADAPMAAKNDLGWPLVPPGGSGSFAFGVNAPGHVVGKWFIPPIPTAFTYPFWFDGAKMHKLATPPPEPGFPTGGSGEAYALNCHDDIVGIIYSGKPGKSGFPLGHAVLWPADAHPMVDLNTLLPSGSGWTLFAAYGINDAKHIVGKGTHPSEMHAFLWLGSGVPIDLGTLPAGHASVAYGINSSDEVVGESDSKEGVRGFILKEGVMTSIGTLKDYPISVAQAINAKGDVVGWVGKLADKAIFEGGTLGPTSHAVIYSGLLKDPLKDLNTLIPPDSGWELKTANDINNKGQIVGTGYYKGSKYLHAYLLTPPGVALTGAPKPTPATAPHCPISIGSGDYIFNNFNVCGVKNGPTKDTTFSIDVPYTITFIATYHWNYGSGALPGGKGISLKGSDDKVYGPWKVTTSAGSGGAPNVGWECHPGITLPAGTYTVIDPDPATWSQNDASGGSGFARVAGHL